MVSRHMRIAVLAALLAGLVPLVCLAAEVRPVGKNCSLSSPPAQAGEEMNHGAVLRIYPRAKDIGAEYTGCQVLFAPHAGKWQVVSLTEVVNGEAVRIWSEHEKDQSVLACRYKSGRLVVGNPDKCPMAEFLLVKSMAPGCVKLVGDSVAKRGPGAQWPKQCEYE